MPATLDKSLPATVVRVAAGVLATHQLGAMFGPISGGACVMNFLDTIQSYGVQYLGGLWPLVECDQDRLRTALLGAVAYLTLWGT